tara:strand:+ start:1768 stop:1878 length:111 start_codon:yes stop_codon:yes gene_type:complete
VIGKFYRLHCKANVAESSTLELINSASIKRLGANKK